MLHPYLRRREGLKKPEYPRPELRAVLEKTLGVPLFQEQAIKVAILGAGFTPAEADQLRRAMATFKFTGGVSHFFREAHRGNGSASVPARVAERTFRQLEALAPMAFLRATPPQNEIGRAEGVTAAFNGIVRQLRRAGCYDDLALS